DEPPTTPWAGVLLANEVLDALPVERFRLARGQVEQLCVIEADGGFAWTTQAAPKALDRAVRQALGEGLEQLPDGFESEICPMLPAWLQAVTSGLTCGCALFIDYGYPRSVYYAAERRMGTLICHYRHRGHDDPFFYPGLQDISAFVDFTALAEAADAAGLPLAGFTSQAMFLLASGLEAQLAELASLPDRERLARAAEVRELTLPSAMGEKFQVMALSRDLDLDLHGFELLDLSHQL
ncbi:MAG TPA: SAM-dependent methyltransferase, partial [Xanthomonadales bacterium]|nr:SAM-dependent methyltransferase [Xanthomonadales bacterium]